MARRRAPRMAAPAASSAAAAVVAATLGLLLVTAAADASDDLLTGDAAAAALAEAVASNPAMISGTAVAAARGVSLVDSTVSSAVAQASAMSPAALGRLAILQSTMRRDPDLKYVAGAEDLMYSCSGLHGAGGDEATSLSSSSSFSTASVALGAAPADASGLPTPIEADPLPADAFRLHSRPGAPKKIVLDFTGHTLRADTAWKQFAKYNWGDIITAAWSLDGDRNTFTNTERTAIVSIWRAVAEDFARWNVDVTTEEPSSDTTLGSGVGVRAIIGPHSGWMKETNVPLGVALLDSFGVLNRGPAAFVFAEAPNAVAKTITHEIGHTFDLLHWGTPANQYYSGHGYWGPIMGSSFGRNVVQWSKGEYANWDIRGDEGWTNPDGSAVTPRSTQDDLAYISTRLAAADFSGGAATFATATRVLAASDLTGVLRSGTEKHYYRIKTTAAGPIGLKLSVVPKGYDNSPRAHLSAQVSVLRGDNQAVVIGTPFNNVGPTGIDGNNPETGVNTVTLPGPGTYVIELAPVGYGDPTSTGYTSYGSGGSYAISLIDGNSILDSTLDPNPDVVTCRSPSYTLTTGKCSGTTPAQSELFTLSAGPAAAPGLPPRGTVSLSGYPTGGLFGPGVFQVVVTATEGGATCTSTVTVVPCKPIVISTRTPVKVDSAAGTCLGAVLPNPSQVITAASLGAGALSLTARTTAKGAVLTPPFKAGRYFVDVVYPGGLKSSLSAGRFVLAVNDSEPPVAAIKQTIAREEGTGAICAVSKGRATSACLNVATTGAASVISLTDNCGTKGLVRKYACVAGTAGSCPTRATAASATKVCVNVSATGGRVDATYAVTITDKGGRATTLSIPIAGYHASKRPAGVTCYSA